MIPSPLPSPIDVNLHSGPAEWWQFLAGLAPLAALVAAGTAGWIAWQTLRQKTAADNRAEWWRRAQWALDSMLSEEPRRAQAGLQVMTVLAEVTPSPEELKIFSGATLDLVDANETDFVRHSTDPSATNPMQPDGYPNEQAADTKITEAGPPRGPGDADGISTPTNDV